MTLRSMSADLKGAKVSKNRSAVFAASSNRAVTAMSRLAPSISSLSSQSTLKVGASNDRFEQEADSVADHVMQKPNEFGSHFQHRSIRSPANSPNTVSRLPSMGNSGQPLAPSTRSFFESRFGHDFSHVRVHADKRAAGMAQSLGANAFTFGQDVVFGEGRYEPDSNKGQRLIAHELAHTIQQGKSTELTSDAASLSHVGGDTIQKDDDDEERQSGSGWNFQIGVGPMTAPGVEGPAAGFYPAPEQLPLPGLLMNRGLGLRFGQGGFDVGVMPNLGGSTEFYGASDIPGLLDFGSSQPETSEGALPQIPIPRQQSQPFNLDGFVPRPFEPVIPDTLQTPSFEPDLTLDTPLHSPLRGLRERTIDRFSVNESSLPTSASADLDLIAFWISMARPLNVWVTGHTDVSASEEHNQELSEARAAAVRQALIDRGIDESIILTSGVGEVNPFILDAETADQHARNRRVTIEWVDAVSMRQPFRLRSPLLNP